jgi:hypothetical protein
MAKQLHPCPVCGHRTLPNRCDWDICPAGFWEDDLPETERDGRSTANHMLLSEGQVDFLLHGAVTLEMMKHVRLPLPEEARDPTWKPLPQLVVAAGGFWIWSRFVPRPLPGVAVGAPMPLGFAAITGSFIACAIILAVHN